MTGSSALCVASGGDSREAGTRTAHPLSYSPYKFPRLTGMRDDFSHARAAAAAPTRMTSSAEQSPFRLLGNGDDVASAATPTSAADQAIDPLTTAALSPISNIHTHAPVLTPVVPEAAASSAVEAETPTCLVTSPTKKKGRARGGTRSTQHIPGDQRRRVQAARSEQAKR